MTQKAASARLPDGFVWFWVLFPAVLPRAMAMAAVFLPKSICWYGCSHIVCFLINQSFLWVPLE
jgi:hypothetical protein